MEYDSTESSSYSELDDFIVSDESDYSTVSWYSGDSTRPQGPSPPSSSANTISTVVNVRRLRRRLRRHGVRPHTYEEPNTQSQESRSLSQATTVTRSSVSSSRRTNSSLSSNQDEDSDDTHFSVETIPLPDDNSFSAETIPLPDDNSFSAETIPDGPYYPESPPYYNPVSPDYEPHSPSYSPSTSPPSEIVHMNLVEPHSPPYSPPVSPRSPSIQGEDEPDVQIIEPQPPALLVVEDPREVEITVEIPHVQELAGPLEDHPQSPQVAQYVDVPTEVVASPPKAHPVAASKLNSSVLSDTDEGSVCTICMDSLTNSGSHRVVCLKCGHIFGHSCVERWIKVGCNSGARRCPTCNKKACLKDIRVLYLPKVVPLDTIEKDLLIREKEEMALQKGFMEKEVTKLKWQNEHNTKKYAEKILKLENELKEAVNTIELLHQGKKIRPLLNNDMKKDGITAQLLHSLEISKIGNCRVLGFCPLLQQVVVSQPTGNTLFAGYGVRLLNTVDFQPGRFIYLHNKVIRDLAFHGEDRGLLLSVALDHTAKLLDITSGSIVHTFKGDGPLWSCCWDTANPHRLLVGSQLGKVWMYDRRMMDAHVNVWENHNKTPVVALTSAPAVAGSPFPQGGFISCRLNGVYAYIRNGGGYKCQELPVEGPFMSMRYNYSSQSLLTCARPSSRCPYTQVSLNLLELDARHNICLPQIHTFNCGSTARVLSRINVFPTINDSLVVAHHESGRSINMWSTKHGELVNTFPTRDPVIDLAPLSLSNNKCLLAALSDKKVDIYKVT